MTNTTDDVNQEVEALRTCMEALQPLNPATRARVLRYLGDRFPAPLLPGGIPIPRRRTSKRPDTA